MIRLAVAESFWTDGVDALPASNARSWWEVWLRGDDDAVLTRFREQAKVMGVTIGAKHLTFPERTVVLAEGSLDQFAASLDFLDTLAELRRLATSGASSPGRFRQKSKPRGRANSLPAPRRPQGRGCHVHPRHRRKPRSRAPHPGARGEGHARVQATVGRRRPQRSRDRDGGDRRLRGPARSARLVGSPRARHRLESAKILPPPPGKNRKELYGALTAEAISYAEIEAPTRPRVISMAITTTEFRDRGQPTSWSSELDKLCAGIDGEPTAVLRFRRERSKGRGLSSGSERDRRHPRSRAGLERADRRRLYGSRARSTSRPYADRADRRRATATCPTSTTSCIWQGQWPLKPDIVMEGGNMALSPTGRRPTFRTRFSSSTYFEPNVRQFTATGDTSAATAAAGALRCDRPRGVPKLGQRRYGRSSSTRRSGLRG